MWTIHYLMCGHVIVGIFIRLCYHGGRVIALYHSSSEHLALR